MPGGRLSRERGGGGAAGVVGARSRGLKGRIRLKKHSEEPGAHLTHQPGWMWPRGCFLLARSCKKQSLSPAAVPGGLHWVAAGVAQQTRSTGPGFSRTP